MNNLLSFLTGLLIRLAIPIGISLLAFYLLHRLDARWQRDSKLLPVMAADQKPCWEIKNCPEEKRKVCPAANQPKVPCWQTFRSKDGLLREPCLDCDIFRQALVPVST